MLEFRKYCGFIAFVALASCNSGGGAVTPSMFSQTPQTAAGKNTTAPDAKRHRERPLAGTGPTIQIATHTMPSEIDNPQTGLQFAYGGLYYTFSGNNGGVGSFNGRYWNDYRSSNAVTEAPLALDSKGDIYSVIEDPVVFIQGILRHDPHTGEQSREYLPTKYSLTQLDSNVAFDSQNRLWIQGEACCSTAVLGVVTNPGTPQQTFTVADEWEFSDFLGYDLVDNLTEGADGHIWASGRTCPGSYAGCSFAIFRFPSSITPYQSNPTAYTVPADPGAMALGPDGNIWFVMHDASEIGRITPSGTVSTFNVGTLSGIGKFSPKAISSGADGAIWFLSDKHALIGRITTSGAVSEYKGFFGETAITRGTSASVPVWFSIAANSTSSATLPGSLNKVTVP